MRRRILFGVVVGLLGVALAFGGGRVLYRAWASARWPEAQGTVRASSMEKQRSKRSALFVPHVSYDYTVGSEHYTSETLAFTSVASGDSGEARDVVQHYPVGTSVQVHYAPDEPSLACLECARTGGADYGVMVGGLLLAGLGAWTLLEALRSHRAQLRRQRRLTRTEPPVSPG